MKTFSILSGVPQGRTNPAVSLQEERTILLRLYRWRAKGIDLADMVEYVLATTFLRNFYIVALSSMRCTSFSCIKISTVSAHLPSSTFHTCTKQTLGRPHSQLLEKLLSVLHGAIQMYQK